MILYNITINIDHSVHDEWMRWMKEKHIPDVMRTGLFIENKICRIHAEEDGGKSYSIQYLAPDMESYERYQKEFAVDLQNDHNARYQGKFAAFRTVLEVVHHHTLRDN